LEVLLGYWFLKWGGNKEIWKEGKIRGRDRVKSGDRGDREHFPFEGLSYLPSRFRSVSGGTVEGPQMTDLALFAGEVVATPSIHVRVVGLFPSFAR
jgi:hypothetical protein